MKNKRMDEIIASAVKQCEALLKENKTQIFSDYERALHRHDGETAFKFAIAMRATIEQTGGTETVKVRIGFGVKVSFDSEQELPAATADMFEEGKTE